MATNPEESPNTEGAVSPETVSETGAPSTGVEAVLSQTESGRKHLELLRGIDINDANIISAGIDALARERVELKYIRKKKRTGGTLEDLTTEEMTQMEKEIKQTAAKIENERENLKDHLGGDAGKRRTYILWRINNPNAAPGSDPSEAEYQKARWDLVEFETKLFVQGLKAGRLFNDLDTLATEFKEYTAGAKAVQIRSSERRAFIEGVSEKIAAYSAMQMKQERIKLRAEEITRREELAEPNFFTRNFRAFQERWRKSVYWRMGIGGGLFVIGTGAAAMGLPFLTAMALGARAALAGISSGIGTTLTTEALIRKFQEKRIQGIGHALTQEGRISQLSGAHGGPRVEQVTNWLAANLAATAEESATHLGETGTAPERPAGRTKERIVATETERRLLDEFYRRLAVKIKDQMGKELVGKVGIGKVGETELNELMMEKITADALKVKLETAKTIREQEEILDQETHRQAQAKRCRRIRRWIIAGATGATVGGLVGYWGMGRAAAAAERAAGLTSTPGAPPLEPGTPTPPAAGAPPLEPGGGSPPVSPGPPIAGPTAPVPGAETPGVAEASEGFQPKPIEWSHGAGENSIKVGDWTSPDKVIIGGHEHSVVDGHFIDDVGVDTDHDGLADGPRIKIDLLTGRGTYDGHIVQAWDKDVDFGTTGDNKFELVARTGRVVDVTGDGKVDVQVWSDDSGMHASHDINVKGFSVDGEIKNPDDVFNRAIKFEHFVPHDGVDLNNAADVARDVARQYELVIGDNYTIGSGGRMVLNEALFNERVGNLAGYLEKDPNLLKLAKEGGLTPDFLKGAHNEAIIAGKVAPAIAETTPQPGAPEAPSLTPDTLEKSGLYPEKIAPTPENQAVRTNVIQALIKTLEGSQPTLAQQAQDFLRSHSQVEIWLGADSNGNGFTDQVAFVDRLTNTAQEFKGLQDVIPMPQAQIPPGAPVSLTI